MRARINYKKLFPQDESSEAQQIQIDVSYPRRNFSTFGSYNMSSSSLSSQMSLVWDKERRTVQAEFDWKRDISHPNRHEVELLIKHPSFQKVGFNSFFSVPICRYLNHFILCSAPTFAEKCKAHKIRNIF